MSLPDYYSRVNPDLLALIPPNAKVVLEIGCGAGALCEAYRKVNPGVEWCGVEINPDAAKIAQSKGVNVVEKDIEAIEWMSTDDFNAWMWVPNIENEDAGVDCLVLGDILEHLLDPWLALKELKDIVRPGAQVLASIPNVQHWTIIRDLLAGHWRYTDEGLLDRTHLRFFTLESIQAMFSQAGLQVFEVRGRDICNEGFEEWRRACGIKATNEMRAYQYIVRAVKPKTMSLEFNGLLSPAGTKTEINATIIPNLHVHAVTAEGCCARPRILEPFAMLGTIPGVTTSTAGGFGRSFEPRVMAPNRILVEQRQREPLPITIRRSISDDWITVAEVDDLPEAIGMDPMALKAVHAIQCSTEKLAKVCRQYNPNVMVFENQIAELPPFVVDDSSGGTPNAGIFFGAQNRQEDWKPIMPAINRIANSPDVAVWFDVVHDHEFFHALKTDAKRFHPFCEYSEYRRILRSCNIALLPLEPGEFNECKSDIKFLECASEGVCVVAPFWLGLPTRSYESIEHFESHLRLLIDHHLLRHDISTNAYAYVRDHRLLSQHYRKRYDWYLSLLSSKQELDQQLLDRCPELRSQEAEPSRPALSTTAP